MLRLMVENAIVLELAKGQTRKLAHGGYRINEQETVVGTMSSYTSHDICEDTCIHSLRYNVSRAAKPHTGPRRRHRFDLPKYDTGPNDLL